MSAPMDINGEKKAAAAERRGERIAKGLKWGLWAALCWCPSR